MGWCVHSPISSSADSYHYNWVIPIDIKRKYDTLFQSLCQECISFFSCVGDMISVIPLSPILKI